MGGLCCKRKSQSNDANDSSKTEVGLISPIDDQEHFSTAVHVTNHESLRKDLEPQAASLSSLQPEDHNKAPKTELTSVVEPATETSSQPPTAEVNSSLQPELYDPEQSRAEHYKRTFTAYYARLCEAVPVEQILPELVSNEVITVHEMEEILAEKTSIAKAQILLNRHIFKGISAGCPKVLTILLFVMCHLNDHTCKALSKEICAKLNSAEPEDASYINRAKSIQHLTHQMSSYQQYLKSKYKVLELTSPDEMLDCASTEYIDLALIKNNQRKRIKRVQDGEGISLSEALNVQEQKKKIILIEGGPGMGKSTLAINICKRWAEGELLQASYAVILLPLREKEIQEAKTIGDLLLILDDKLREHVTKEIIMNNGENICFLCEGFDELPINLRKSSMVASLIQKLPKCTVIYTSRPEACSELQSVDTRVIAIDGFKEESIDEYISKTFENIDNGKEMASQLKSKVKSNNWIRRILHVPINVAIVCLIFYHFSVLPDTLTQLYTLLFLRLILRHVTTRTPNVAQIRQLTSLNNLPPDISEQFSQVCFIAYKGMVEGQAIFSSQDLCDIEVPEENLSGLGLLLITPSFSVYGRGKSYSFVHLTLQEFSAAWFLSKLCPKEQLMHFQYFRPMENFEMVWMFYSGITGLRNEEVVHTMLPITNKLVKSDYTHGKTIDIILSVYEAQNSEVCRIIGDYLEGSIDFNGIPYGYKNKQQVLIHALGYFVMEYTGMLRLISLSNINLSTEELTVLIESLKYRSKQLLHNKVLSSNLILKLYTEVTFSSTLLNSLIELLENYPITELYTHGVVKDMQVLSQLLCSKNSLNVLDVASIFYHPPVCITNFNTTPCDLRITGCGLSNTTMIDGVGEMLSYCKSVMSVDLSFNNLGDSGVKKLVNHLKDNATLQHLNLSGNGITAIGIESLRKLITSDPLVLTGIVLSHNPLKDEGVCLFLQTAVTDFMECIEFAEVSMTSSSHECVANVLNKVRSISFTVCDDSDIISNSIANATTLEKIELNDLKYSYCNIINGINQNKNIKTISLRYSYSNRDSFTNLERLIRYNKSVTELNLSFREDVCMFLLGIAGV